MRTLLLSLAIGLGLAFATPAHAGVDINAADASVLEGLPGIGPSKAAAIVQYRTEHGPFKTVDDLDNVPGIGPSTLASLRDQVSVGKGGAPGTPGASKAPEAKPATGASAAAAPVSAAAGCPVNINSADASALQNLPGIGASKAAAIIQHRTDNGTFASCDALDDVSGIGAATIAGLRDCCTVK
ncbi:MAG: ComEA family DNA-binding protein [Myxococcota bacterium]